MLRSVAAEHGTPTYVYDLETISARFAEIRSAFPGASVHYAVKANALGALLRHLCQLGAGAEALTLGELERSLRAGFDPSSIVLGGPGHTPELAHRAVQAGVGLVSLDSRGAWKVWRESAAAMRFVVRLNPAFDPHTHEHLATAAAHSKFGMPLSEAVAVAEEVAARGQLAGFHVHAGSMIDQPIVAELIVEALEPLYQRFEDLEVVDVGGGFAVPNPPLTRFAEPVMDFAERHGVRLLLEPGRFLVAESGVLLTRVLHVKSGGPVRHVIADAGMADLLRPALYDAEHPIRTLGASSESSAYAADAPSAAAPGDFRPLDVDGPLCENADRLGRDVEIPFPTPGALLAVEQAGAYGFAMASNYASNLRPAQVVVEDGHVWLASRREKPEDLWRLETDLLPYPSPALGAREVLDAVMASLTDLGHGAAALHRFASDGLRAKLGSPADQRRTLSNEAFAPLFGGSGLVVEDYDERDDVARAVVLAQDARFVVSLAKRDHGRAAGCWLLTALARDLPGA